MSTSYNMSGRGFKRSRADLGGVAKRPRSSGSGASRRNRPTTVALIKRVMASQEERKYLDNYQASTTSTAGTTACINQIAEGDDYNNRIGRKVSLKNIQYDVFIDVSNAAATEAGFWCLVLDKQSNNALAGYTTVFDTSVIAAPFAFKNDATFQERFQMLKFEPFVVSPSGNGGCHYRGFLPLETLLPEDQVVQYAGTAAGVPNKNAILMCYGSTGGAGDVTITYGIRIKYVDV